MAASRSVSKAAGMNNLSQSAASQHLQELERQWNVKLFDRTRRPLELTPAGSLYYDFCKEVVRLYAQFRADLDQECGRAAKVCRVASIYSVGLSEMSALEQRFSSTFPKGELRVEYLRPERVYEAVLEDRADLGLVSYPESRRGLTVTPWREERMVVVTGPSHPFVGRESVAPKDLEGEDFVAFDDDLPISRDIKRFLKDAGVTVHQVVHFDNIQSMKEAVALGSGLSILPEPIVRVDVEQGRLSVTPLAAEGLARPLGILRAKKKKLNPAAEAFLQLLLR